MKPISEWTLEELLQCITTYQERKQRLLKSGDIGKLLVDTRLYNLILDELNQRGYLPLDALTYASDNPSSAGLNIQTE